MSDHIEDVINSIIDEHAKKVALKSLRTVSKDEQVFTQCLAFYEELVRDPQGHLHRQHVCTLYWMLDHCTDDGLRQCADTFEPLAPMTTPKQCFARIAQVILQRRGVGRTSILVN